MMQCHQLKTGAFVLCEKTAKQMQLVGAGLCSARQDTPNYRKSSANPYALTRLAVEADAGHSRSRRRSVTDVGLPLAGTHRPGRMHRFYGNLRRICNFSMGRQSRRPLQQPFVLSVGGGRLCPPAGCTDFTGIFGEFTAAPYIQRGNCLRIRRKFSKEFTAFCRAEQSPAPTNCGCISTVFA